MEYECTKETKPLYTNVFNELQNSDAKLQEVYKNITSSMKTDPLLIDKPIVALELFSTAVKIKNQLLAKQCIENLNNHLDKNNVLLILQRISNTTVKNFDSYNTEPSAPPLIEDERDYQDDWVQDLVDNLRNNCFLEIDKNADYILKQKEILELDYCDILNITTRDTLEVSSEILVYSTVMRWCMEECKRRHLEIQRIHLKAVLRDLVYAPRYGLMSKKEFLSRSIDGVKGPDRSGILDENETEQILEYIKNREKNRPVQELPFKCGVPRKIGNQKPYKIQRLHSGSYCSTKSTCDKFMINFLTCWTAVFD